MALAQGQSGAMEYYRPIAMTDMARPSDALTLAGGWCWFDRVEVLRRDRAPRLIPCAELPKDVRTRLTAPRPPLARLDMDAPRIMAIINATPDSFSNGGQVGDVADARAALAAGADIVDIGGESTRPGAVTVPEDEEAARVVPVARALRDVPVSIDTRKASVAQAASGDLVNDVSAGLYDPAMLQTVAAGGQAICLMHAQGNPQDMQVAPAYDDVLLDVYDHLAARIAEAEGAGIPRSRICVDPGVGFGKTVAHNLALIRGLSLFHALGCPILLGASRKRFIGTIAGVDQAQARMPGSIAVALAGVAQGAQIIRVHDVAETRQAVSLWQALGGPYDS